MIEGRKENGKNGGKKEGRGKEREGWREEGRKRRREKGKKEGSKVKKERITDELERAELRY